MLAKPAAGVMNHSDGQGLPDGVIPISTANSLGRRYSCGSPMPRHLATVPASRSNTGPIATCRN